MRDPSSGPAPPRDVRGDAGDSADGGSETTAAGGAEHEARLGGGRRLRETGDDESTDPSRRSAPFRSAAAIAYERLARQAIAIPVVLLALTAVLLISQVERLRWASRWVNHTDKVISQADIVLRLMVDAQAGELGYMVGGDRFFLSPYTHAQAVLPSAFDRLERIVRDDPPQVRRARTMRAGFLRWTRRAEQQLTLRGSGNDVQLRFNRRIAWDLMNDLRAQHAVFVATEQGLRRTRVDAESRAARATDLAATVLLVVVGGILALFSRRQMRLLSKQYEQALDLMGESRRNLAVTLNSIGDAVLVTDARGSITLMNPIAESLTGWTLAEAGGKPATSVFRIVDETTWNAVESPIDRVIREGVVVGLANHTLLIRKDGVRVPIDDSGAPIRNEVGDVIGVVLVFRDVSARRATELALRAAHKRLDFHVANTPLAVVEWDRDFKITRWSAEAARIFGWSEQEVVGKHIDSFGLTYPPDKPLVEVVVSGMADGSNPSNVNRNRNVTRSGDIVDCEWYNSSLRDDDGNLISILSLVLDVTERNRLDASLEARIREIETIMEVAPVAILIGHDPECRRITGNRVGFEMLQLAPEQDLSVHASVPEGPAYSVRRDGRSVVDTDLPLHVAAAHGVDVRGSEYEIVFASGEVTYVFGSASPLRDADGNVRGAVGAFLDITQRKKTEQAVAELNARLQRTVAETHHRVKNNLQVISALIEMLADESETSVSTDEVRALGYHVRGLAAIHDLLTEKSKAGQRVDELSARSAIGKLLPLLQSMARGRSIRAEMTDAEIPTRQAGAVTLIVNELVSNAIKYSEGDITVSLAVDDNTARLQVNDDGVGFPSDFDSVASAHTGLELVRNLCQLDLGGTVAFDNRASGGARVTVTFPLPRH